MEELKLIGARALQICNHKQNLKISFLKKLHLKNNNALYSTKHVSVNGQSLTNHTFPLFGVVCLFLTLVQSSLVNHTLSSTSAERIISLVLRLSVAHYIDYKG